MNSQLLEIFRNGNINRSEVYDILSKNSQLLKNCEKIYSSEFLLSAKDSVNVIDTYNINEVNIENDESIKQYYQKFINSPNGINKVMAFIYYIYLMQYTKQNGGKSKINKANKINNKIHTGTRGGKYKLVNGKKKYMK
jgi:hypothetical protein